VQRVTGRDGKTYPRTDPKPVTETPAETAARIADALPKKRERRRPLPDAFFAAGYDLNKVIERIDRLFRDDRFTANKKQVADQIGHHLPHAIQVLQDLDRELNS